MYPHFEASIFAGVCFIAVWMDLGISLCSRSDLDVDAYEIDRKDLLDVIPVPEKEFAQFK